MLSAFPLSWAGSAVNIGSINGLLTDYIAFLSIAGAPIGFFFGSPKRWVMDKFLFYGRGNHNDLVLAGFARLD